MYVPLIKISTLKQKRAKMKYGHHALLPQAQPK